jgi:hypothetical protein
MKKVVLTSVFALVFGCLVSYADVSPRGGKGPEKPKIEKIDKKGGDKNHVAPKPNHKPVAHKPSHKPNKHVAHKPHKPAPKPVCHVKHHHKPECHKPVVCCNRPVHHNCNHVNGVVAGAVTTAAVVGLIAAIAN